MTDTALATEKKRLRTTIRARKKLIDHDEKRRQSAEVCRMLLADSVVRASVRIALYSPLDDEIDISEATNALANDGKEVYLPHVINGCDMCFCRYEGEDNLCKGAFGIMEPSGERLSDASCLDVIVVPGVAFDFSGNRMGRGRGFYDRALSSMRATYKIGVCFDFQKVANVPTDEFDIKMDSVICPCGGQ